MGWDLGARTHISGVKLGGGHMSASIGHLSEKNLTFAVADSRGGALEAFVVTIVIVQICLAFKKGLSRSLDLD